MNAIDRARHSLSGAIDYLARRERAYTGIGMVAVADAPDTWEALQAVDLTAGVLPVWDGASGSTVYATPEDNYAFRYWHDMGHLRHGLSFTPDDEITLQHEHHLPRVAAIVGTDSLAYRLYHADTVGQIEYVMQHHRFPDDQLAFGVAYLRDRARALDTVF